MPFKRLVLIGFAAACATVQAADFEVRIPHRVKLAQAGPGSEVVQPPTLTKRLELSASSLNLGAVPKGQNSLAQSFTVTNTGTGPVSLGGVTVLPAPSDFSATTTCGQTLIAEASCTVSVVMAPSRIGVINAALEVTSDATETVPAVSLTGTGTAPVFALWSSTDKGDHINLSTDRRTAMADGSASGWRMVRANIGKSGGKHVFEVRASVLGGDGLLSGFSDRNASLTAELGTTGLAVGFTGNGFARTSGATGAGNLSYSTSTVMFALDLTAGKGWIAQGGSWKKGNPATGTNPSFTWLPGSTVYPTVSFRTTYDYSYVANFGNAMFTNPVPAGFEPGWY